MTQRGLRPREEIRAGLLRLRQEHHDWLALSPRPDRDPEDTYTAGRILTMEWMLGAADSTPLTVRGGVNLEDVREIDRESDLATDMLQGRTPMDLPGQHGPDHLAGREARLRPTADADPLLTLSRSAGLSRPGGGLHPRR